jgi:DNA (cytosine-5)-methyltransferase 1
VSELVLSLFPGIGLLDMAFDEAGFCVVRGPDVLWGGDIHAFHPPAGRFDGVIGGPPCQHWSALTNIVRQRYGDSAVAPDLIPEFKRCVVEAKPDWFLMENAPRSPEITIDNYAIRSIVLNNRWLGQEQNRVRRFSFGLLGEEVAIDLWRYLEIEAMESPDYEYAVTARGSMAPGQRVGRAMPKPLGPSWATVKDAIRLQGLPADHLDRFLDGTPLTAAGAQRMIGNGVPLPMGRAIANAVKAAIGAMSCP